MKFSNQPVSSEMPTLGPGVSRETWRGGLFWRQYAGFGGRLLFKSVAFGGIFRGYALGNPEQVRRAASERSALLVDICEQLLIAHALKVPLDGLMLEARALIEDIYAAKDGRGHGAGVFGLPAATSESETPQSGTVQSDGTQSEAA